MICEIIENMKYDGEMFLFEDVDEVMDYCDGFIDITEEKASEIIDELNSSIEDEMDDVDSEILRGYKQDLL